MRGPNGNQYNVMQPKGIRGHQVQIDCAYYEKGQSRPGGAEKQDARICIRS